MGMLVQLLRVVSMNRSRTPGTGLSHLRNAGCSKSHCGTIHSSGESHRPPESAEMGHSNTNASLKEPDGGSFLSTLTFFFADLEGSTPMVRRLGDVYMEVLRTYHTIVNAAVARHGGETVATEGDGFFCVFPSPGGAIEAAADILAAMESQNWPGGERPRCRIGVHTGIATRTTEGYVGLDVHRASRIGSAANGGQVLISTVTNGLVKAEAERAGWGIVDLGEFELSGIGEPERLFRVEIPGIEQVTTVPRARASQGMKLPRQPRPIVGRAADLEGASEMLMRDSVRMVTITGPGGTGKTRLAVELAGRTGAAFPDGGVFVELASIRDPARILPAIGRALEVRESGERDVIEGLQAVVGDARMLFVLDNMEHLLDAAPEVARLLEALPNIKMLVTSRSPLRITWENEYPLSPLPVPGRFADSGAIRSSDAVTLFVERARTVRPGFELDEATEPVVAEITRKLDGLPLAIELAAARLRLFPVETLLERLDDRLSLLDKAAADAPDRHKTLRAAIQWSHDLLTEAEKVVFRRLSVFTGGWTLDAALEVCRDDDRSDIDILDVLDELVAKSLVVFALDDRGQPRYRMLETLREFSIERLLEAGEEVEYRHRHIEWCHGMTAKIAEILATPEFPAFLDRVELERFNIRSALNWSLATGERLDEALAICGHLPLYWDTRGYVTEGIEFTRKLTAMTDDISRSRGMALAALGWLEMLGGQPDASEQALDMAVAMFRTLQDKEWLCRALAMQGMTTYNRNNFDVAEAQFRESMGLAAAHGLQWLADAWCAYGLAHIALSKGDFPKAQTLLEGAYEFSRDHGLTWGVGHTQLSLGVLAFMMGDLDQSYSRLWDSIRVRQELRDARGTCDCLGMIALLASVKGDHEFAAVMLGAAEIAREASGHHAVPWLQPMLEQAQMSAQLALEDAYEEKLAEGRDLSTDEAVVLIRERFRPAEASASVHL